MNVAKELILVAEDLMAAEAAAPKLMSKWKEIKEGEKFNIKGKRGNVCHIYESGLDRASVVEQINVIAYRKILKSWQIRGKYGISRNLPFKVGDIISIRTRNITTILIRTDKVKCFPVHAHQLNRCFSQIAF